MSAIFLSHAHTDMATTERVARELNAAGYEVWWDEELSAHRAFYDEIEERLRAAPAVVVLWTESAIRSQWVRAEADFARTNGKLVQVSLDGNMPPLPFNQIQYAKLNSGAGLTGNREWQRVLDSVHALAHPDRERVDPPTPASQVQTYRWRYAVISVLLAIIAIPAAIYLFSTRHTAPDRSSAVGAPLLAVLPFEPLGGDQKAQVFAAAIADATAGSLSENFVRTIPVRQADIFAGAGRFPALAELGADFALGGTVRVADGRLYVRTTLEEMSSRAIVWSSQFDRPFDHEGLLLSAVAGAVTDTAFAVSEALEQPGIRLDPQTLSMFLKAEEQMKSPLPTGSERAIATLEQVIAKAPDFAQAHGNLALLLANNPGTPEAVTAMHARAHREVERAISLYPGAGSAYDARYSLVRYETPMDLRLAESVLLDGLQHAPRFAFLHMRYCEFLMDVGRIAESLTPCEQAVALRPLAAPPSYRRALANWFAGRTDLAFKLMDEAWAQNPNHVSVSATRFMMLVFGGRPYDAALALADPEQRPALLTTEDVTLFRHFLDVQSAPTPADVDSVLEESAASQQSGRLASVFEILMASYFGRTEMALDLLGRLDPGTLVGRMLLFHPVLEPLRRDPRFIRILGRSGHVAYWLGTDLWPDFCSDPGLPYDCREEAAETLRAH